MTSPVTPAIIGSGMILLLRAVRQGATLQALIAISGSKASVLVSRKTIGSSARKILAADLAATAGIQYFPGVCLFEENVLTFVLQAHASGLAKKLRQALLRQTEQRFEVRVRGIEPGDVDQDRDDEEDATPEAAAKALAHHRATAKACLELWMQARIRTDEKIRHLASVIAERADPALQKVASRALKAVSEKIAASLADALGGYARQSHPKDQAGSRLRSEIATVRAALSGSPQIELLENNPYGVSLDLRGDLDAALLRMEGLLATA